MVWALTPVDTVRGAQRCYIFAAGTYKVGRKDCDVIVQTDTSISRVHAEIVVEKMVAWDPQSGAPANPSYVRVVDCSKYGTFFNKVQGTQGSRLHKDEDAMLADGDTVTFGTGNATFRLSFVPIVAFFHGKKSGRISPSLQAVMTSIGAYATRKWSDECTHVLVDESCSLTPELLDAVLAKKQIVLGDWFKVMAEKNIHTEMPSSTQYIPKLTLDGMEIQVVEIKLIESCLAGYTFILGSSEKYKFGDKLHALLESTGANYLHVDEFCANSQDSGAGENDKEILLVPAKSPLEFSKIRGLFPLSKITDVKLFAAILSGHLEATAIEPPAYIVASSNSTDETIVVDSDVEIDTATSDHTVAASKSEHHIEHISDDKKEVVAISEEDAVNLVEAKTSINLHSDQEKDEIVKPMEEDVKVIEKTATMRGFKVEGEDIPVMTKVPKDETLDSRDETCHVIYTQNLVVKSILQSARAESIETGGINFKRFRKRGAVSGNSFKDLIPYSREPYRESDYERGTVTDFMREEKKRRQMEAIAEDLFNNAKPKKKAAAGSSIHTMLTGRR
ncbi:nibrin homolog [Oryza glaberrima]|uniref:nibrin homolog n=1 Tax=Oryza glaberrima TaxID=4538 RepID=UPI00224C4FA0|nr:nibrin homolog [Oryza glaberrima]